MKTQYILSTYDYEYAKHHDIPVEWIPKSERLQLASYLEYLVSDQTLTLPDARRRYVQEYPESNRLDVPKTIYFWKDGVYTYKHDWTYAKGSVLSMIAPYEDEKRSPIREVSNII